MGQTIPLLHILTVAMPAPVMAQYSLGFEILYHMLNSRTSQRIKSFGFDLEGRAIVGPWEK
jgi:hypothetical protein